MNLCGDIGLLILRVGFGGTMLLSHGLGKLMAFSEHSASFPDPIGVGPTASMALAVFAEAVCAALVVLGIGTRLAAVPLIVTMAVAALVIHAADPWQKKEMAILYGTVFVALFFTGGGKYSLGHLGFCKKCLKWS